MKFLGQDRIWNELQYIIPEMKAGHNLNIILRSPSGWGKTKLATVIALQLEDCVDNIEYVLPYDDGTIELDDRKRVIVIDEVHTLKQPEVLYPLMDSKQHVFILCSNESGELKEPLVNRCIDLSFEDYTLSEIGAIILQDLNNLGINISGDCLKLLAENSNFNPRMARQLAERVSIIYKNREIVDVNALRQVLENVLQLQDGLGPVHRRYLTYLEKVRRASLDSIAFATRIDKKTILREVEPVLIQKDLIFINSKGRNIK